MDKNVFTSWRVFSRHDLAPRCHKGSDRWSQICKRDLELGRSVQRRRPCQTRRCWNEFMWQHYSHYAWKPTCHFSAKKNILPRKTGWVFNFVDDDLQNLFRQDEERFGPNLKLKNRMSHHFNKQQSRFQLAPQRAK